MSAGTSGGSVMDEEEIMQRAREAALISYAAEFSGRVVTNQDERDFRAGERDKWWVVVSAAQALRDLSKPLSEIVPTDPDLIEARKIAADLIREHSRPRLSSSLAEQIEGGKMDRDVTVQIPLAAIKRGRELAERERQS